MTVPLAGTGRAWTRPVLRSCALLLLVVHSAACTGARPAPTLPASAPPASSPVMPPFGPHGEQTPPTLEAYVQAAGFSTTRRIEFVHPRTGDTHVVTDGQLIRQVIELLRAPDWVPTAPASGAQPERAFLLVVSTPDQGRIVSAEYDPQTSRLRLANVPNGYWPVKLRGLYEVPPTFGQALFTVLGIR